jgi:hypothetical protein
MGLTSMHSFCWQHPRPPTRAPTLKTQAESVLLLPLVTKTRAHHALRLQPLWQPKLLWHL